MRYLPLVAAAAIGLSVLTTGCSSVDRAQACIEANKAISDAGAKLTTLANDPKAMDKALRDAATKLDAAADTAGNTTLNEALGKLADSFKKLDVDNPDEAAKAARKVATDSAEAIRTVAEQCT